MRNSSRRSLCVPLFGSAHGDKVEGDACLLRKGSQPVSVDYVAWIEDVLKRKPHINQAGLARHLGRDRSVVTMILRRERALKPAEIDKISEYLGEPPPGHGLPMAEFAPAVGRIGTAWYEPGQAPPSNRRVAPVLERPDVRQEAYEVDARVMDIPAGSVLIVAPLARNVVARDGDLVVVRRTRAGLENVTLSRVGESKDEVLALVLEVRIPV